MNYVIQLIGLVNGPPSEYDGQYLARFDFDGAEPGEAILEAVAEPERAKHFADLEAARQEWMKVDPRQPRRADGLPNRPLTAFTVSLERVGVGSVRALVHSLSAFEP